MQAHSGDVKAPESDSPADHDTLGECYSSLQQTDNKVNSTVETNT